ncbi:MAG TPA: UrcA family protein [Sphingomicrobium sp.]|nr:UrcA family protein [Sphingomicrobium sp.]
MRTLIISTLIAVTAASPAGAQGRTAEGRATVERVSFKDLDLNTTAGLRQLRRRIANATEAVCDSYAGKEQYEQDQVTRCRKAVARMVEPQLARIMRQDDVQSAATVSR